MDHSIMTAAREYGMLPAYEIEQLIAIYEASGRSCDLDTLKATARKLYPVDNEEDEPPLYLCQGSFVGWVDADGYMQKAKYTLGTRRARCIGIMADGEIKEY